ncbi:oxidoreductase [Actinoalloteichus sp. AHMU CJ021]|uniref:zinc-binding dehydrogenase n=1 Tax=Actinoalloteichus sp. AHMU CJ021 TaxID=2072503 RepID=UPI000CA015B1|nr:oxidoreductase [Actinoalloteichus sp. AHMU CJ021]
MRAITLSSFGPADHLVLAEVPDPVPAAGQVRVRVAASGVHLVDTQLRRGEPAGPAKAPDLPAVLGREVAGTVDAVGDGVDRGWLGRRVVAHLGSVASAGGYAELAVAPAASLHPVPDELTPEAAVAMIGTGRTALAVLDTVTPGPADVVLVLAAAGGLGTLFTQEALAVGATVVGLAGGPEKVDRVRALGAQVAVDYRKEDWPAAVSAALGPDRAPTMVLDGVGGQLGRRALELLGPGGRLAMYGWASGGGPTEITTADLVGRGLTASWGLGALRRPGALRELEERALRAAATGRLRPELTTYPLAEAAASHRALEERRTVGKVVLLP